MKIGIICSAVTILVASNALAEDAGMYGRIDSGYSWSTDGNLDGSGIIGAGIGYRFNDHVRGDVTLGYRGWYQASESASVTGNTVSGSADIESTDGLVNAYYDIGQFGRFTPYVGGGIGFAYNNTRSANVALNGVNIGQIGGDSETNFAWQAGFGTAVSILDNLALDVGYRYIDLGSAETSNTFTANNGATVSGVRQSVNVRGSELQAGLRYSF
jgi:opacity protein-like surface antigen